VGEVSVKSAIFLLVLCCVSFALIDPPVQEVDQHNRGMVPQGIMRQNFFNYTEREPTLDDPTTFFYVKILTLTPSVNLSITSKPNLHPALIWMVTEKHNDTVREGYNNGNCDERMVTRHFQGIKVKEVTAYYSLDGLRHQVGDETLYNTANRTVVLADNTTGAFSASDVPFREGAWCAFINLINTPISNLLGGMINLSCYDESLAYCSPYGTGVYNLTVRNLTIVNPHLNVTLQGTFTMDYTEQGTEEHMEGTECKTDSWDGNGTITLVSSDFASYEVQNDYITVLPYLPGVFSLSGNTSEDVMYHESLLSNSNLYKYYSKMDNQTAGAYYVYAFNVTQDGYGTQSITATEINHTGLLPEDPQSQNNYTGPHRILDVTWGNALRSPTEMNSLAYNYSRIYDFEEVFYNVSDGEHHAELEFHTLFGSYTALSDINVSSLTAMTLYAYPAGNSIVAMCTLMSRNKPVAGQTVELRAGNQTLTAVTNSLGVCTATFDSGGGPTTVFADFKGTSTLLPSGANYAVLSLTLPTLSLTNFSIGNFGILLMLSALFALSFLGMARSFSPFGGGAAIGNASKRFYPFAPKGVPKGKPAVRVKQGKELATSVAVAAATGGAGGAAAGKAAEEAAKKKLAEEAAKKEAAKKTAAEESKKKMLRELTEKEGKKQTKFDAAGKRRSPEEVDELRKAWAMRDATALKLRESHKKMGDRIVEEVKKDVELIRTEKTVLIQNMFPGAENEEIRKHLTERLKQTNAYVVEQKTWRAEIVKIGGNPDAHAVTFIDSKEIFISQKRAINPETREKSIRHEFDHIICRYREEILHEGHADWTPKYEMKDRWHPTLTSYPIPTEIYGKLAELAGETYENNHSAYRLGSGKMQEKLFEKYPAATKEINAVFDSMIGVSAQDVIATKRVSVKVNALYKKVEPQKYAESIKRNDG
jgi:hypothetical protein